MVEALGKGEAHVTERTPGCGWQLRATKARLLKNSNMDSRDSTHIGWKRDLSLTLHAGQELPEVIFGDCSLERLHDPSGVRLSFSALDALRCWALLDLRPVPHYAEFQRQQQEQQETGAVAAVGCGAGSHAWDYTFTTPYAGRTDVAPLGRGLPAQPGPQCCNSMYARPAVDLAKGKATLRKAMCNCTNGRTPLLSAAAAPATASVCVSPSGHVNSSEDGTAVSAETVAATLRPPPPLWAPQTAPTQTAARHTDLSLLLRSDPRTTAPFFDTLNLWLDNLDPHSLSFLRVSVVVADTFWFVQQRCFVRVNGVMARVIDTKLSCAFGDKANGTGTAMVVHRERSWREGSWAQLCAGTPGLVSDESGGLPRHVDFGGVEDRLACERLPHRHPPIFDQLVLPSDTVLGAARETSPPMWVRNLRCEAVCGLGVDPHTAGGLVVIEADGARIGVVDVFGPDDFIWNRDAPGGTMVLAASISPAERRCSERLLALGDDCGSVHIWSAANGAPLA